MSGRRKRHYQRASRRKASLRIAASALLPVGALAAVAISGVGSAARAAVMPGDSITVVAEGRPRRVRVGGEVQTVAGVLRAAKVATRSGRLRAARSGQAIGGISIAPTYVLDGVNAAPDSLIGAARTLEVHDGADRVEPTVEREGGPIAPPPLPAIEYGLWHPGLPGRARLVVGAASGEVVTSVADPPTPPTPVTEKVVALTFDDGPWPDTPDFVRVLHDEGVRATFCMIGRQIPGYIDAVHQVAAAGMTLCNHTVDHNMYLDRASSDAVRSDIEGGRDAIAAAVGRPPAFYRPPGGTLSPAIVASANRAGERVMHWTLDSMDYRHLSADAITRRVVSLMTPGAIVLMHDGGGDRSQTLAALPNIIEALRAQGYAFATPDGIGPAERPASPAIRAATYLRAGTV